MSAQAYYQGDPSGGGGDRNYDQQQSYSNYGPPQGGPPQGGGGYGNYPPPSAPPQSYQQQAPNGWNQQQQQYNGGYAPPPGGPPVPNNGGPASYGMKPSQPYAPQNGGNAEFQPQNYQDTAPFSQADEKTGQRMNPKPRFNDIVFLILFIAAFIGFVVVSALALRDFSAFDGLGGGFGRGSGGSSTTLNFHTVYLLLIVCAVGLVWATLWLVLVRAFTKIIIEVTLALTVLLNIAICIYYYYIRLWSAAIIFTIVAVLSVVFYWSMRKRIPLAKLLVQTTIDISKHHKSVYVVVFISLIIQAAWSVYYSLTVVAIYVKWTPGSESCTDTSCSSSKVAGLIFYATFAYYWVSQVIANVTLTTLSGGVFGGWYYFGPRSPMGGVPKRATLKALARSCSYNLGSIAFGSLIVTILELLRLILNAAAQQARSEGDMIGAILACCAACCVSCIAYLVEFFNKLSRSVSRRFQPFIPFQMADDPALYGKAYIPAAKDTWRLMKDRGIDALINDSLIGTVIMWGAYVNGFLCALFGYLYLRFTDPAYNSEGQYTPVIILFSFLIGINEGLCLGSVLDAGASTIFVGLGEDPMVLADRSPALFDMIRQAYPRVIQGIPARH